MVPLQILRDWSAFKIDALGLVTLLGADEVDIAVGRLGQNPYTDCLPLLGAYVFASNHFTKAIPGFVEYNINKGITSSDIPGWFTRWLLSQEVRNNATRFIVSSTDKPRPLSTAFKACAIGISIHSILVVLAALMGDWWGLANAVSMGIATTVRRFLVYQNKKALDNAALEGSLGGEVRTFWTLPTGDAVTIVGPEGIIVNCLLSSPKIKTISKSSPVYNDIARSIGWLAFGAHVITLGMAAPFIQILTVLILLGSTVLVVRRTGDDDTIIGSRVQILKVKEDPKDSDTRAESYARLNLNDREEQAMMHWNLFPLPSNESWWKRYRNCQLRGDFQNWKGVLALDGDGLQGLEGPDPKGECPPEIRSALAATSPSGD